MEENSMYLAEENIELAYKVAWEYYNKLKTKVELEELQSVCFLGLTKAAKSFDTTKGIKFSTFSYRCMKNEVVKFINQNIKHNYISLSQELTEDLTLEDTLQSDINVEQTIEDNIRIETLYKYIDKLNEKDKLIVTSYLKGLNTHQIASILNISEKQLNVLYRKAINKLRFMYVRGGEYEWDI